MEYLNKSKICREFLNQYSDTIYPELLPKLIKVAIYALHKTFHKWNFSMEEVDQFINCCYLKNRNLDLESKYYIDIDCPCPPCKEYLNPIQKLNMGYQPPEGESNSEVENGAIDSHGYGKFYPNDDVYINDKNNFYDENYYIPKTHSYRNIQLYHKRLNNPKFITQEKKIYPHWWWNIKDDIEQDDYSDDDSFLDHVPSRKGRFPKDIEDKIKKKAKRFLRNKSYNGQRRIINPYYDESRIFPNSNLDTNNNNLDNSPYPKRDYSPFPSDDESQHPFGTSERDRFGRPFPRAGDGIPTDNNNPKNPNMDNIDNDTLSKSPLYSTSPNLNYRPGTGTGIGTGNPLGLDNRPGLGTDDFNKNNGIGNNYGMPGTGNQSLYNPKGQGQGQGQGQGINSLGMGTIGMSTGGIGIGMGTDNNLLRTNTVKSQILRKRLTKQSTVLSYDKDFNVNGAYTKVKGQEKKGLKYSLSGNQLKEDKRGIKRRKKK